MPQARAIVPDSGAIRPGYNATGSTLAKNRIVKKSTGGVDYVQNATDGTAPLYGATMQAITDGYAGDVQVGGRCVVEASAAIAIGAHITATTGGKAVTASTGNQTLGVAASSAAADGELIEVDIMRGVAP